VSFRFRSSQDWRCERRFRAPSADKKSAKPISARGMRPAAKAKRCELQNHDTKVVEQWSKYLRRWVWPIATAMVAVLAGFVAFVASLPEPGSARVESADGIVALTGEGGRLVPAMDLLEDGLGQRLLISGVNPSTTKGSLKNLLHGGELFDCCVDLGFSALDTRGNAEETARWARDHHYKSLIIVTVDYHMPRSLVEFGSEMPEVKLIPYPVADAIDSPNWLTVRRLGSEYFKYLASSVRAFVISSTHQAQA